MIDNNQLQQKIAEAEALLGKLNDKQEALKDLEFDDPRQAPDQLVVLKQDFGSMLRMLQERIDLLQACTGSSQVDQSTTSQAIADIEKIKSSVQAAAKRPEVIETLLRVAGEMLQTEKTFITSVNKLDVSSLRETLTNKLPEYVQRRSTVQQAIDSLELFSALANPLPAELEQTLQQKPSAESAAQFVEQLHNRFVNNAEVTAYFDGIITMAVNQNMLINLVDQAKLAGSEQLSISSALISPVQRLPRYVLLLKEMKKQHQKANPFMDEDDATTNKLDALIELFKGKADLVNESVRAAETVAASESAANYAVTSAEQNKENVLRNSQTVFLDDIVKELQSAITALEEKQGEQKNPKHAKVLVDKKEACEDLILKFQTLSNAVEQQDPNAETKLATSMQRHIAQTKQAHPKLVTKKDMLGDFVKQAEKLEKEIAHRRNSTKVVGSVEQYKAVVTPQLDFLGEKITQLQSMVAKYDDRIKQAKTSSKRLAHKHQGLLEIVEKLNTLSLKVENRFSAEVSDKYSLQVQVKAIITEAIEKNPKVLDGVFSKTKSALKKTVSDAGKVDKRIKEELGFKKSSKASRLIGLFSPRKSTHLYVEKAKAFATETKPQESTIAPPVLSAPTA